MNLINDPWIPVLLKNGEFDKIPPASIADESVKEISAVRPDFQGALYQILIGLLQTFYQPEDTNDWFDRYKSPPSVKELNAVFSGGASVFELNQSEGSAFMQDFDLSGGESRAISTLLIESPGDNTLKKNLDFFVKRDLIECMCAGCAATALFTLQCNAPSGGAGHRVGIRGGGPLTTLIRPQDRDASLWHKLWINIIDGEQFEPTPKVFDDKIFPWLGKTRVSDPKSGSGTFPEDAHPLQNYWGMPRRISLEPDSIPGVCDICHEKFDIGYRSFRTQNYGVNYQGAWVHPLTPYRYDKEKEPLSLKGQYGGFGYRQWLGLLFQIEEKKRQDRPAKVVQNYLENKSSKLKDRLPARLWCFGYDMDNMKACCWYEQEFPFLYLEGEQKEYVLTIILELIETANSTTFLLRQHVKQALFDRPEDVKGDMSFVDAEFWQKTEEGFFQTVSLIQKFTEKRSENEQPVEAYKFWYQTLHRTAEGLFDYFTLRSSTQNLNLRRIMGARNAFVGKFYGGKQIKALRQKINADLEVAQ